MCIEVNGDIFGQILQNVNCKRQGDSRKSSTTNRERQETHGNQAIWQGNSCKTSISMWETKKFTEIKYSDVRGKRIHVKQIPRWSKGIHVKHSISKEIEFSSRPSCWSWIMLRMVYTIKSQLYNFSFFEPKYLGNY